jgi:Mg-chelatase subunit ChlD
VRNRVAGQGTQLADGDVEFGVSRRSSESQRYTFTAGASPPNAVRVNARRDAQSLSGAVAMVMPTFGAMSHFGLAQTAVSTQVEVDVALVLDRSGSMAFGDLEDSVTMVAQGRPPASAPAGWQFCNAAPPASRWRNLVTATGAFLVALNASPQIERVSLVTYGSTATRDAELTADYAAVTQGMDAYTQHYCSGSTNIHDGISAGVASLNDPLHARPWAVKVLIVMTDGRRTAGPDPVPAAIAAFDQQITVYAVTFANEADQAVMRSVASAGGGLHYHAATGNELMQLFRTIARRLPTLLTQ